MLTFCLLLGATILIKSLTIWGFQRSLRRRCSSTLESLLAAWLMVQTALIGCLLLLSCFGAMNPTGFWLCLTGLACASLVAARFVQGGVHPAPGIPFIRRVAADPPLAVGLVSAASVLGALALHGAFFYDTTDDGLYYGLSRIAYWYQHHSILAFEPTQAVHLFIFDWNGELNALSYFLATGRDRACAFGNIEVWFVFLLSLVFCFRSFRAGPAAAWAGGFLFSCMPAALLIALTVKGDLGAGVGCLLGLVWTVHALRPSASGFESFWAIAALSYAAGSKLSCVPLAAPLLLMHLLLLVRQATLPAPMAVTALLVAGLNACHSAVNCLHYGSPLPFPAMLSGQPALTLAHFLSTARGLLSALFTRGLELRMTYAIFAGCGVIGLLSLMMALVASVVPHTSLLAQERRLHPRWAAFGAVIFFGSFAYVMSSLPWFAWSFRYFLPWMVPLLLLPFLVFLDSGNHPSPPVRWGIFCHGLLLLGFLHVFAVYRPSEITPGDSLPHAFRQAARATDLERKVRARPALLPDFARLLSPRPGKSGPLTILLLSGVSDFIFPYFGDNASNQVALADSAETLLHRVAVQNFDLVVITRPDQAGVGIASRLAQHGYVLLPSSTGLAFSKPGS